MSEAHSEYSASGFEAAMLCPGKRVMERGLPDSSSKYADEGTAAHAALADLLDGKPLQQAYLVGNTWWDVTTDMYDAVHSALAAIRTIAGDGMVLSEQRVNYSHFLGVETDEAWGTADVIVAVEHELQVHDYKHGRGVEVFADENPQMMLYALGALAQAQGVLGDFTQVRMVIHQPRIKDEPSQWMCTVEDLELWAKNEARNAVSKRQEAATFRHADPVVGIERLSAGEWEAMYLKPNEKSCKFCRAKSTCPALRDDAVRTVFEIVPAEPSDFEGLAPAERVKQSDSDWLAAVLSKADMIEDYLKSVRAEVEARLLQGEPIPGFKIVEGKRGNRAWADPAAAEAQLKAMRLKVEEMYDLKLISPTTAEKLSKAKVIGPRQWKTLQESISRSDGAKHVAPVTDPRPALVLTPAADDFSDVSTASLPQLA